MDPASIDEAKDLLYQLPLETFVAERDGLVKQIRAAGDRDLANEVKALRKPSAVAAEVNQIVRADPAGIELILQAAALLRSAQAGALEGSIINASELQQQYRAAIQGLSQSAPTRRAEVRAALEAATIDEASNDDLRSGCLVVVPKPTSLFGMAPRPPAEAPSTPSKEPAPPVDELEARRARRRASNAKAQPEPTKQDQAENEAADKQAAEKEAEARAKAAKEAAAKEAAAAEKQRAAEAEAARKRDEKERRRKLQALKKTHRDALRGHLAALDAEEAATAAAEQAEQALGEAEEEQHGLEEALATLRARIAEVTEKRTTADAAKAEAHQLAEQAEAEVDALADAISALEDG